MGKRTNMMKYRSFLCGALGLISTAAMADSVPRITADRFVTPPTVFVSENKRVCASGRKIAEYLRAGKLNRIPELLADNAVWLAPTGDVLKGPEGARAAIAKTEQQIANLPPVDELPLSMFGEGHDCYMELAVKPANQTEYRLTAAMHIVENDAGKIVELVSYLRPARKTEPGENYPH